MTPAEVPPAYIQRVSQIESNGNPLARSRTSSATGEFQFITATWMDLIRRHPYLRLTADGRTDRRQAEAAFRVFTSENAACMASSLRRDPTPAELYLGHFLGSTRACQVIKANPTRPLTEVVGPKAVQANAFMRGRTCGWLRDWAEAKMAGRAMR